MDGWVGREGRSGLEKGVLGRMRILKEDEIMGEFVCVKLSTGRVSTD